jgi:hypothetical protein
VLWGQAFSRCCARLQRLGFGDGRRANGKGLCWRCQSICRQVNLMEFLMEIGSIVVCLDIDGNARGKITTRFGML